MNNALVETFVIHLRNVIEFLYRGMADPGSPKGIYRGLPRKTDVTAGDFCPRGGWSPPAITQALKDAHARADKEVGHLTSERRAPGDGGKAWNSAALLNELLPTMQLFAKTAALPTRLSPKMVALFP